MYSFIFIYLSSIYSNQASLNMIRIADCYCIFYVVDFISSMVVFKNSWIQKIEEEGKERSMVDKKKERNECTYHRIPFTYYVTLFIFIHFISRNKNSTNEFLPLREKIVRLPIIVTFLPILRDWLKTVKWGAFFHEYLTLFEWWIVVWYDTALCYEWRATAVKWTVLWWESWCKTQICLCTVLFYASSAYCTVQYHTAPHCTLMYLTSRRAAA